MALQVQVMVLRAVLPLYKQLERSFGGKKSIEKTKLLEIDFHVILFLR